MHNVQHVHTQHIHIHIMRKHNTQHTQVVHTYTGIVYNSLSTVQQGNDNIVLMTQHTISVCKWIQCVIITYTLLYNRYTLSVNISPDHTQ